MSKPLHASSLALCAALALPACGPEDAPPVGEALGPIINGAPISPTNSSIVALWHGSSFFCSGALLTNGWVLSARHCFTPADVADPGSITVTMQGFAVAKEIILHQSRDVALVKLSNPLLMNGTTSGFERNLYRGWPAPLSGRQVRCAGYGRNTFTGGSGTLRQATLTVSSEGSGLFTVAPNGAGQIPWRGDSGSPCLVVQPDGREAVAGIASTCTYNEGAQQVLSCDYVDARLVREWVAETRTSKELIARHSGKCVAARNVGTANGLVEQATCSGAELQKWRLDYAGVSGAGELFRIRETSQGKCLTVPSGQLGDGVALLQSPCSATSDNQRFLLENVGGLQRVRSYYSGRCLDVPSSSLADGVPIQQFGCHAGANQQFTLRVNVEDGAHEIKALVSAKCFDIPSASQAPGTQLQQSLCNAGSNQNFRFEPVGTALYRVHPQHSGLCLDVPNGSLADGTILQQFTCNPGLNQRFELIHQYPGIYSVRGRNSGKCLDIPGGQTGNGVRVQQFTCHGGLNQQYRLSL